MTLPEQIREAEAELSWLRRPKTNEELLKPPTLLLGSIRKSMQDNSRSEVEDRSSESRMHCWLFALVRGRSSLFGSSLLSSGLLLLGKAPTTAFAA
jgi:hypothetical protein